MPIKTIIIDDESRARALLEGMLKEYCPEVEVVAAAGDLPNGVKAIRKYNPQLVFLDIEMPGHSGLEIMDFFDQDACKFSVIFTTAYDQYAIQAFKLSAIDYLLKPIEPDDLQSAVRRYQKRQAGEQSAQNQALRELRSNEPLRIVVPTSNGAKFLEPRSIVYFKAENSYTEITTADGQKLLVSRTLKNFEEALTGSANRFFRCHKSYLINIDHISDYIKSDGGLVVLQNKYQVPISGDKVQEFLDMNIYIKR